MLRIDLLEVLIVILGIETSFRLTLIFTSADNAPRTAVAFAWSGDGVLMVKAAWLTGQGALVVAKHVAVLAVQKRAASKDVPVDFLSGFGQAGQSHQDGGVCCLRLGMTTGKGF